MVEAVNSFELFDEMIDRLGEPITAETMKDYHRILKRGTADARRPLFSVGEYKRVPNAVGGRETVAPEHVALAVEDLIARTPARRGRLFRGGFEGVGREGRGGGLLGRVLPVRRVVAKASECVSPLRLDGASRMVGRCLACRDAADSRARTSSRRSRGLSDDLGGYPTISRTAAPGAAAPRASRCAPRP